MDATTMRMFTDQADDDDPLRALSATAQLTRELARREAISVRRARSAGIPWSQIASVLGVSRQAVHRKYGGSRFSRD